jgi:NAD(P)-dependent dehydrogenase (short-subunit alcohol dehydrogenase family)
MVPKPLTILITGGSSGIGLSLTTLALSQGHKVFSTTRSVSKVSAQHAGLTSNPNLTWVSLDVNSPSTTSTVDTLARQHGIDVVINNAAYAAVGALEDFSDEEIEAQFQTNVIGLLRVCRGVVPLFRERGSGWIVNVGSAAGIRGLYGRTLYSGSKFAVAGMPPFYYLLLLFFLYRTHCKTILTHDSGITECLAHELAPFNIRVLLVELGAFKTNFLDKGRVVYTATQTKAYENTPMGEMIKGAKEVGMANVKGDPNKAAARILEVISGEGIGAQIGSELRLLLGADCLGRMEQKIGELNAALEKNRPVAVTTDLDAES